MMAEECTATQQSKSKIFTHNGVFTVKSTKTGEHRTFRISTMPKNGQFAPGKRVVSLLVGPDNTQDYKQFGFVYDDNISVWSRLRGGQFDDLAYMLKHLDVYIENGKVEVFAATRCRICNKPLTTPESVESGIGPICAQTKSEL